MTGWFLSIGCHFRFRFRFSRDTMTEYWHRFTTTVIGLMTFTLSRHGDIDDT